MIKKLMLILLLQISFASCVCAQKVIDWRATRDSVAKHADKFLEVEGVKLRAGMTMKRALEIFDAIGWKPDPFYDVEEDDLQLHILYGTSLGIKNCAMFIAPTDKDRNIVGIIGITYIESNSFKKLKETYDKVKKSLSEKNYALSSREYFKDKETENSKSNKKKLQALAQDEAVFETTFTASDNPDYNVLGYASLFIERYKDKTGSFNSVSVIYSTSDKFIEEVEDNPEFMFPR